jgi:hypothetical protein
VTSEPAQAIPAPGSGAPPDKWEIGELVGTGLFDEELLRLARVEYGNASIVAAFRAGFHAARASAPSMTPDAEKERVIAAIVNPGRSPAYHAEQVVRLAAEWPTLASALAALLRKTSTNVPQAWARFTR